MQNASNFCKVALPATSDLGSGGKAFRYQVYLLSQTVTWTSAGKPDRTPLYAS
jgi:hypothetical protein